MLIKFRRNSVALTADIEKAFLMVGIKKEHRDMLRFLWFDCASADKPEMVEYRFNRLVFGLRPSPSILGSTIAHHLNLFKQSDPELVELLEESLYVDDLITGDMNDERAYEIYKKSKEIMSKGGFNLRKWNSNSRELLNRISKDKSGQEIVCQHNESSKVANCAHEDDESYAKLSTGMDNSATKGDHIIVKVLGMNWNTDSDEIFFETTSLYDYAFTLPFTKRSVLKVTAKIFDPIGLLTPFTIRMKVLFQELCVTKFNWDEELQGELLNRWKSILDELKQLSSVRIPRCYFDATPEEVQVHGFCDASELSYAAVVYLRSRYPDGRVEVQLVASKSRVAPLKRQTIPRLELLGAVILARLIESLKTSGVKSTKTALWTDSTTTLCWIKNAGNWKQYVRHRVDEISCLTSKDSWRHCPGKLNPADLPSRGMTAKELRNNENWWNGPEFLGKPENEWPNTKPTNAEDEVVLVETVKNPPTITHSLVNSDVDQHERNISKVMDISRFSNLTRLLRVTALVIRFVNALKSRIGKIDRHKDMTKRDRQIEFWGT